MVRRLAPVGLLAGGALALAALFAWSPPESAQTGAAAVFFLAVAAFVCGTDWWLLRLRRTPVVPGGRGRRVGAILLLGAPSLIFSALATGFIATVGDNAWMAAPYALAPVLMVWPFVIAALARVIPVRSATVDGG